MPPRVVKRYSREKNKYSIVATNMNMQVFVSSITNFTVIDEILTHALDFFRMRINEW